MMITLNVIENAGKDYISGSYNGKQFSVSHDTEKYQLMQELQDKADTAQTVEELKGIVEQFAPLTVESYKEWVETKTPYIVVNPKTNRFYLRYSNVVSRHPLPTVFSDKIMKMVDKSLPIDPLIKCWARYLRQIPGRPAFRDQQADMFARYISAPYTDHLELNRLMNEEGLSLEVATARATSTQVAITREGLLACYKVSEELNDMFILDENEEAKKVSRFGKTIDPDTGIVSYNKADHNEDRTFRPYIMKDGGDEFWCVGDGINKKGHIIKVGCSIFLESWDQVGAPMQKGLHCGGLNYIKGYQQDGTMTHNILVDPMHIHTIAGLGEGSDGAMTVKQYFVLNEFSGVNKTVYHPSTYAALTDKEYASIVEEVVKATAAKQDELKALLEEAHALGQSDSAPAASDVLA